MDLPFLTSFRSPFRRWLALAAAAAVIGTAQAHSVWIEPDAAGQPVLRFGELDGDVETSPGRLDDLEAPLAFIIGTDGKPVLLASTKQADHLRLEKAAAAAVVAAEVAYPVMAHGEPAVARRPVFYSRWQPAGWTETKPALTLDIVPGRTPGEARIYFRGQPLAGAKLKLYSPAGKHTPLTADAEGYVKFEANDKGRWSLTLGRHSEDQAGFAAGIAYTVLSHNASLSWLQP